MPNFNHSFGDNHPWSFRRCWASTASQDLHRKGGLKMMLIVSWSIPILASVLSFIIPPAFSSELSFGFFIFAFSENWSLTALYTRGSKLWLYQTRPWSFWFTLVKSATSEMHLLASYERCSACSWSLPFAIQFQDLKNYQKVPSVQLVINYNRH